MPDISGQYFFFNSLPHNWLTNITSHLSHSPGKVKCSFTNPNMYFTAAKNTTSVLNDEYKILMLFSFVMVYSIKTILKTRFGGHTNIFICDHDDKTIYKDKDNEKV